MGDIIGINTQRIAYSPCSHTPVEPIHAVGCALLASLYFYKTRRNQLQRQDAGIKKHSTYLFSGLISPWDFLAYSQWQTGSWKTT